MAESVEGTRMIEMLSILDSDIQCLSLWEINHENKGIVVCTNGLWTRNGHEEVNDTSVSQVIIRINCSRLLVSSSTRWKNGIAFCRHVNNDFYLVHSLLEVQGVLVGCLRIEQHWQPV